MARWLVFLPMLLACSSDKTSQSECDDIANQIRAAAQQRGVQSAGVCASTNPQIQKDFADACARLKDCNDRCCK